MNSALRKALIAAAAGGAVAISSVLIKEGEGLRYTPYLDTGGVLTVCYGHTGKDIIKSKTYTQAECDAFLKKDQEDARKAVDRLINVPLNPWQEAALIDFVFNLGAGNLESSTMRRKFNAGDYKGGCDELQRWVKGRVNGQLVTLNGLKTRRGVANEICLYW